MNKNHDSQDKPKAVHPNTAGHPMNHQRVHDMESILTKPLNDRPDSPDHHTRRAVRRLVLACLISFLLGYWLSDRRLNKRVNAAADDRIKEFVQFCDAIGVLDKAALTEAIIIASEAEWEDKDAEQCKAEGIR